MDYYGAGADLARMRAEDDREFTYYWECVVLHLHFGMVGKFPPESDTCPSVEEDEMCFECPVTDTAYAHIHQRLQETPEIVKCSIDFVIEQDKRNVMERAEEMYQEYRRVRGWCSR